jgi:hypothetical protein
LDAPKVHVFMLAPITRLGEFTPTRTWRTTVPVYGSWGRGLFCPSCGAFQRKHCPKNKGSNKPQFIVKALLWESSFPNFSVWDSRSVFLGLFMCRFWCVSTPTTGVKGTPQGHIWPDWWAWFGDQSKPWNEHHWHQFADIKQSLGVYLPSRSQQCPEQRNISVKQKMKNRRIQHEGSVSKVQRYGFFGRQKVSCSPHQIELLKPQTGTPGPLLTQLK